VTPGVTCSTVQSGACLARWCVRHRGVGFAPQPPVWLLPGDVIGVSIEGVGTIRNRVVAEHGAPADWRWRRATTKSGLYLVG
jgi:2-keto-4-pentenoate hydratase/2-oxohepta-3-ene-1,7-dioic acid hydratase in catechol pathway